MTSKFTRSVSNGKQLAGVGMAKRGRKSRVVPER